MNNAKTRITASAMRKILTLSRNARAMSGNDSWKRSRSKNACLTSGQPAALTTTSTIAPKKTIVLSTETATARRPLPPGDAEPSIREPRASLSALPQLWCALCDPPVLERLDRAVRPQPVQRTIDAPHVRAVLRQHDPEVLARAARRESSDDHAVLELDVHDVAGRREVHDDAVDLLRVQCRDRVRLAVVHVRLLRGLDERVHVVVCGRSDRDAELVGAEPRHGLHPRDRRAGVRDDSLVHEVVRVREGGVLCALRQVRDLGDVDVERLLPGLERGRPYQGRPGDLLLREAELARDRIRDCGLVSLSAVRVRDLPWLLLCAAEERRERRIVRADGERPLFEQCEVTLPAAPDRGMRRGVTRRGRRETEGENSETDYETTDTHEFDSSRECLPQPGECISVRASVSPWPVPCL